MLKQKRQRRRRAAQGLLLSGWHLFPGSQLAGKAPPRWSRLHVSSHGSPQDRRCFCRSPGCAKQRRVQSGSQQLLRTLRAARAASLCCREPLLRASTHKPPFIKRTSAALCWTPQNLIRFHVHVSKEKGQKVVGDFSSWHLRGTAAPRAGKARRHSAAARGSGSARHGPAGAAAARHARLRLRLSAPHGPAPRTQPLPQLPSRHYRAAPRRSAAASC